MSVSSPMQGSIPITPPYPQNAGLAKLSYPEDCDKSDKEWEPEFRETFSKGTLRMGIQGYHAGKYTQRFIEVYLEFMHLSGYINNLEYLEFKNKIIKE